MVTQHSARTLIEWPPCVCLIQCRNLLLFQAAQNYPPLNNTHRSLLLAYGDEFLRLKLITLEVNGDCEVRDRVGCDLFSDSLKIGELAHITAFTELSDAFVLEAH
jgi:hypothetical protein